MLNTPDNVKSIHFFKDNIGFPIVIYACSDSETMQVGYLESNVKKGTFTSYLICKWCIAHEISYQIIYPVCKLDILKKPLKFFAFLHLKIKLKMV